MPRRPSPLDVLRSAGHGEAKRRWIRGVEGRDRLALHAIYAMDLAMFRRAVQRFRPDAVHIHGDELKSAPIIEECIRQGLPFVVTVHLLYALSDVKRTWDTSIQGPLLRYVQEHGGTISFVSTANRRRAIDAFGLEAEGTAVVLNGCHLQPVPQEAPERAILQVGTLNVRKNHAAVLRALAHVPDVAYWIAGAGDEEPSLRAAVETQRLGSRVRFVGRVSDEELDGLYRRASGLVLPSLNEGLALVVLESLARGRPVVTFDDLDGAEDLHYPDAVCLVARSDKALAEGIRWLVDEPHDPTTVHAVAERFSWDEAAKQYVTLLTSARS